MRIPYVIDNQDHVLADVLKALLAEHKGKSLDVATAFFSIRGFDVIRKGLDGPGSFRLLLGAEPRQGEQIGLRPARRRFRCIRYIIGILRRWRNGYGSNHAPDGF